LENENELFSKRESLEKGYGSLGIGLSDNKEGNAKREE
jgi:hypothetical protein